MDAVFQLVSEYAPAGDQPEAIRRLAEGFEKSAGASQVLEGVTGSGKTFTMANVIARLGLPTLVISHNKTLAAQLYGELKAFFPNNAVEYFVSYYDYYQPEAYIPQTDTYIAKDSAINDEIERFRLAATNSLLLRKDVIIVASVSCIYGLGSPEDYLEMTIDLRPGEAIARDALLEKLVAIQYTRNDYEPSPGTFRVRGDTVDVFLSYDNAKFIRLEFFGDDVETIRECEAVSGKTLRTLPRTIISPAKHFVMPQEKIEPAFDRIRQEMAEQVAFFERNNKLIEAQRIRQRTEYDLMMLKEIGFCQGIENYSRHLAGRAAGSPGACLIDYFKAPFLTIIDESHASIPQLRAMYNGDQARKGTLIDHGFRLPSARDNRPLNFSEFNAKLGATLYVSATPAEYERAMSAQVVEQVIRPTGLLDPPVEVRPLAGQIDDLMEEVRSCAERHDRALVTTLTKKTAEDLSRYLREAGLKVEYLHSDVDTLERVQILTRLRKGEFDCLVGINLLREGLDLPEVALVAILDADKEGFLRSSRSLIQTAGRTARHLSGRVILYADTVTDSMRSMMDITRARREKQMRYNQEHGITPASVKRALSESDAIHDNAETLDQRIVAEDGEDYDFLRTLHRLETEMLSAAEALEFERAATLRDDIARLKALHGDERTGL
ncbi:MAG: excinuclease ABC subunit UvrB [Kiritimatiellaeota bacterium]|nr:excinuclease ABC subunit UvrB [Kiritimatiellota bacterium]